MVVIDPVWTGLVLPWDPQRGAKRSLLSKVEARKD